VIGAPDKIDHEESAIKELKTYRNGKSKEKSLEAGKSKEIFIVG